LEQKQGKAISLYLHAADELTVEQVDKRTLALRQEGKTETNKNPLFMFTSLKMNTDILGIKLGKLRLKHLLIQTIQLWQKH